MSPLAPCYDSSKATARWVKLDLKGAYKLSEMITKTWLNILNKRILIQQSSLACQVGLSPFLLRDLYTGEFEGDTRS